MKLKEAHLHLLFRIGVALKGIDGLVEAAAGLALFFTSRGGLQNLVDWLTQGELQEDPTDFVANHLVRFFHHLSVSTQHFASVYLLTYGIAKVGLAAGLLRGIPWVYPAALAVLGLFLGYQVYRFAGNHSPGLGFVSLIDLFILGLIWREYLHLRRGGA